MWRGVARGALERGVTQLPHCPGGYTGGADVYDG